MSASPRPDDAILAVLERQRAELARVAHERGIDPRSELRMFDRGQQAIERKLQEAQRDG